MRSISAALALLSAPLLRVLANPASLPFNDCFDATGNVSQKLTISNIWGQVLEDGALLDLVLVGNSPLNIVGRQNESLNLATLFTSTTILTLDAWSNSSYLCAHLRPQDSGLDAAKDSDDDYFCPIPAGAFALSAQIPWGANRALTTLTTRLRAVDTYSKELMCVDVETTPLDPKSDEHPYGQADIIFWSTVALAIAYWLVVGIARIVSAWNRGISRPGKGGWERVQSAGFILASAMSGERFSTLPALLRFCTPSLRDVIFHTQWCSALAMVAVQWPSFVYPLLTQTAWATLSYNVSLTDGTRDHLWNPLYTPDFNPPDAFNNQFDDSSSSLYLDPNVPNTLFNLPQNASAGIESFAYAVGVRPEDLFGVCMIIFLGIVAGAIALSLIIWIVDRLCHTLSKSLGNRDSQGMSFNASKDMLDSPIGAVSSEDGKQYNGLPIARSSSRFGLNNERGLSRGPWNRLRNSFGSFHGSVLHGNLVRVLILFHLPVSIFSAYHMTLPASRAPIGTRALAGLAFAIISVLIPAHLVLRVRFTTTSKLYDETKTLLAFGPLYNHYRHGSQMFASFFFASNVAFGVTIGAGQKSGTAQAIVILVIEVVSALVTSIWLPWGIGASMGLISFLFCVARIVVAVLMLILTPAVNIGAGAGGWVAYGVLVMLALVYLALVAMLVFKLIEALVRLLGLVSFDESRHVVDTGLIGACGMAGCCGSRKARRRRKRAQAKNAKGKNGTAGKHSRAQDSMASSFLGSTLNGPIRPSGKEANGSMNSGPPPSVLKPEHALRPYREDSDEEDGYIMGAWQPFPAKGAQQGYIPVEQPPPSKPSSGFSRVGGGRAHIDTPYAIRAGSTQQFPNMPSPLSPAPYTASAASLPRRVDVEEEMPSVSSIGVVPQHYDTHYETAAGPSGLPSGAAMPFHTRTRSQTAIIEHASAGHASMHASAGSNKGLSAYYNQPRQPRTGPTPPPSAFPADDSSDDEDTPKKKRWFNLRRHRPHSADGPSSSGPSLSRQTPEELPLEPTSTSAPGTGRSFVVVRKGQGQSTPPPAQKRTIKLSTASTPAMSMDYSGASQRHSAAG